MKQQLISL